MISEASIVFCADWAKEASGRAVWIADLEDARVCRASGFEWSFTSVLDSAIQCERPAIVAFDVPIGVSASFLQAWPETTSFVDLLDQSIRTFGFFEPCLVPEEWSSRRPFFRVPAGAGSRLGFVEEARRQGIDLLRAVDHATRANPMFIVSGIPGSVGSAAAALWREMAEAHASERRRFSVWPFESATDRPAVAEIYPRIAYHDAIGGRPPGKKSDPSFRNAAVDRLVAATWVRDASVRFEHVDAARASDDDLDALMTAAALLRRTLERRPLVQGFDPIAEGAMLLH